MSSYEFIIIVKLLEDPELPDLTTIPLSKRTRDRLRSLGKKGESYDALLNRLMDVYVNRTVQFERVP